MLQGIETIFDDLEQMLHDLKKKSYEANTEVFVRENGFYFEEMKEYVEAAEDKDAAVEELAQCFVNAVDKKFKNKKGKINARTQMDLNFFMIYYVFPTILKLESPDAKRIADGICKVWSRTFKESDIQYTDYDTLYASFREEDFVNLLIVPRKECRELPQKLFGGSSFVFFKCFDEVA